MDLTALRNRIAALNYNADDTDLQTDIVNLALIKVSDSTIRVAWRKRDKIRREAEKAAKAAEKAAKAAEKAAKAAAPAPAEAPVPDTVAA